MKQDLADVTGTAYTYLHERHDAGWQLDGVLPRGERVRLRFINAAAMTYFDVRKSACPSPSSPPTARPCTRVTVRGRAKRPTM